MGYLKEHGTEEQQKLILPFMGSVDWIMNQIAELRKKVEAKKKSIRTDVYAKGPLYDDNADWKENTDKHLHIYDLVMFIKALDDKTINTTLSRYKGANKAKAIQHFLITYGLLIIHFFLA